MTKRSRSERLARENVNARMKEIEYAWVRSMPADVAAAFQRDVEAAEARGPLPKPPDMAPGTLPRPPRPGHEPKPAKEAARPNRRG